MGIKKFNFIFFFGIWKCRLVSGWEIGLSSFFLSRCSRKVKFLNFKLVLCEIIRHKLNRELIRLEDIEPKDDWRRHRTRDQLCLNKYGNIHLFVSSESNTFIAAKHSTQETPKSYHHEKCYLLDVYYFFFVFISFLILPTLHCQSLANFIQQKKTFFLIHELSGEPKLIYLEVINWVFLTLSVYFAIRSSCKPENQIPSSPFQFVFSFLASQVIDQKRNILLPRFSSPAL